MHRAAARDDSRSAMALLCADADVNARDHAGNAPLHEAARTGSYATAMHLLAEGAHTKITNNKRQTPPMVARVSGHHSLAVILERAGRRRWLVDAAFERVFGRV